MSNYVFFLLGLLLACGSLFMVKLFKYLRDTLYMNHREG